MKLGVYVSYIMHQIISVEILFLINYLIPVLEAGTISSCVNNFCYIYECILVNECYAIC